MMKLIEIFDQIISDITASGQYDVKTAIDENLLHTYVMLGELLNPENAYEYDSYKDDIYYFNDSSDNRFCARLVYQPTKEPYWEFKTRWVDPKASRPVYHRLPDNTSAKDWDKRSDTVAKIFRDEVIPKFSKQTYSNVMKIIPLDSKRYQLSIRMVKKFIPNDWELIENFPREIVIKKSTEDI